MIGTTGKVGRDIGIYFDVGGVLMDDHLGAMHARETFAKIAEATGLDPDVAVSTWRRMQDGMDLGTHGSDDLARELGVDPTTFAAEMVRVHAIHDDIRDLIEWTKARGHRIGLATNFAKDWLRAILRRDGGESTYGVICCSSEIRKAKPRREFFEEAERLMGTSDILFVDDKPSNVEAAQKHGWKTILAEPGWEDVFRETIR